ncbi:hypothetical protein AAVH_40442 [Aphelenchoides avenae]|nr:hypothetical protein AAVH_40442 [Aphelenchus avenae]
MPGPSTFFFHTFAIAYSSTSMHQYMITQFRDAVTDTFEVDFYELYKLPLDSTKKWGDLSQNLNYSNLPLFESAQDDTPHPQSVLLRFERGGFIYLLMSRNPPVIENWVPLSGLKSEWNGSALTLYRYGYGSNNTTRLLTSVATLLDCHPPVERCDDAVFNCSVGREPLSKDFIPTVATFSEAYAPYVSEESLAAVYVVYKNRRAWDLQEAVCWFKLDDIDKTLVRTQWCKREV